MSHIFISYSRRDLEFAQTIVDALGENGLETWIDWKSIPKGEDWEEEIYRGIEEADAFLFLISPDSVKSSMCNKEVLHAIRNNKRILPVLLKETRTREILDLTAREEIERLNWIFCRKGQDDFSEAIEHIQTTIQTDYDWVRFHTALQAKALTWEKAKKDSSRLLRGNELREARRIIARYKHLESPQLTSSQTLYMQNSRRISTRQKTIVLAVFIFVLFSLIWLDKSWIRIMNIRPSPPSISTVFVEIQGLEFLPSQTAAMVRNGYDKDYLITVDDQSPSEFDKTVLIRISRADSEKVSIELDLPVTPAHQLDFLPEVRNFATQFVKPDEALILIQGALPYSVGRYAESIKALEMTDSLAGKTLLAQAYLFENNFESSLRMYDEAIKLAEESGKDAGPLRMGAALASWRPGLSQVISDPAVREANSVECQNAKGQYLEALTSSSVPTDYYYIFMIASHYCSRAGWDEEIEMGIEPDDSTPLSIFAYLLKELDPEAPYNQNVVEGLNRAGKDLLYARFELSLYYLAKNGELDLCRQFASSRDWYREGAFTQLDRDNYKYLLRLSCN